VQFKKNDGAPPIGGENVDSRANSTVPQRRSTDIDSSATAASRSHQTEDRAAKNEGTIKEKLSGLSLRQRKFLEDFIALGIDERDLIVDVADKMMVYFKDKAL
jgi:hypothetical protein